MRNWRNRLAQWTAISLAVSALSVTPWTNLGDSGTVKAAAAPITVEAESMALSGYSVENLSTASGGKGIKTEGTGSAVTTFGGSTGYYDLKVRYFDENDGNASYTIYVNGVSKGSWTANQNLGDNYASAQTLTSYSVPFLSLKNGDQIKLEGTKNNGDYARVDNIQFSSYDFEAEQMTLSGYSVESNSAASGGKLVKTSGTGTAAFIFQGSGALYDIKVHYFDENDGVSPYRLLVNGHEVETWKADKDLGANYANSATRTSKTRKLIYLGAGYEVKLEGKFQGGESARLDLVELLPFTQPSNPQRIKPDLQKNHGAWQLMENGQPFLALGGEFECCEIKWGTDLQVLDENLQHAKNQNVNTVLIPVAWDRVEKVEGQYDWTTVDNIINMVRSKRMHVILLWYGAYKNLQSYYAPDWVLNDKTKYPRSIESDGTSTNTLSAHSQNTLDADIRAFKKFMERVEAKDAGHNTVLMVQVENEAGGGVDSVTGRDHSSAAVTAWNGNVPSSLMTFLSNRKGSLTPWLENVWGRGGYKTSGTWSQVFGTDKKAGQVFQAWYFSRYIERVTAAGKTIYDLPMFVNAWLDATGSPDAEWIDIWQAGGPSIDVIAGDLYGGEFKKEIAAFDVQDNPIMVPETSPRSISGGRAWWAYAQHDAFEFGTYWIEQRKSRVKESYALLREMAPVILSKQGTSDLIGMYQTDNSQDSWTDTVGGYNVKITPTAPWPSEQEVVDGGELPGCGAIVKVGTDEFVIVGTKVKVEFSKSGSSLDVSYAYKGRYEDGQWIQGSAVSLTDKGSTIEIALTNENAVFDQIRFKLKY